MSKHGRVIISRMIELIGEYESGRLGLRDLLDDLASMYQSLEPAEQPSEREWLDLFIPLDRAVSEREGRDRQETGRRIEECLARLKRILAASQPAA